ncbi:Uncharacterised protein [Mycobacteroides abscessus subsp. abscessus]|nr:Uncharacterised protein [Mycobacteroides abscessus subsp. abscessus]
MSAAASCLAESDVNCPLISVLPPGMGSRIAGALITLESSVKAVWVPCCQWAEV